MNEKARDIGSQAGSTNRQPGWFARRPAMTLLSTRLRIFPSLHPLVNRLSAWSHNLASRWLSFHPARRAWRGILDLSLHPGTAFRARRDMRCVPDKISGKQIARRGLQTLSLPEGIRIEEPPDTEVEQPAELSQALPAEEFPSVIADTQTTSASPSSPERTTIPQGGLPKFTGSAAQKVSRLAWPFRLVSPRAVKSRPGAGYFSHGKMEVSAARAAQPAASGASGGMGSPGKFLRRSRVPRTDQETDRLRLAPRPMAARQQPITTDQSLITVLEPGQALGMLTLFEGHWQPPTRQFSSDEWTEGSAAEQQRLQPEPRSTGKRTLQRKALPETRRIPTQRVSLKSAQTVQTPLQFQDATSQVQPPGAMLTLLPARQTEPEAAQAAGAQSVQGMLEQEWPLLGVLRHLETQPEQPAEPAALQVLRRMWPAQAPLVRRTLQGLASAGPGERLPAAVSETMQARLGRDFSDVRLHTSALVQTLRAEAFTSGRNIVFAPGRLDVTTAKGLALLGHELTHIGQPLAFKQESSAGQVFEDSQERIARQQEESIQHIVEQGWPKGRPMELQHPARSAAAPAITATSAFIQRQVEENNASAQPMAASGAPPAPGPAPASAGQPAGGGQSGGQAGPPTSSGPAGAPAPNANVDALARQVYGILKNRLRAERDRRQLYNF
ncbi:MAG: DUF4157 domain-containing protein [Anaerolineaceae bacterium]